MGVLFLKGKVKIICIASYIYGNLCMSIIKEASSMRDFFNAAFPWIIMGLVVAIAVGYMSSKKKIQYSKK